jgi:hypothetical protein
LGFYISRRTDGQLDIDEYDRLERVEFGGKVCTEFSKAGEL